MSIESYKHIVEEGGADGAPLIFTFHGTGGDEQQFPELARQLMPSATIVSPRGDVSEGGALRFFRRTGEGVYDMEDLAARTERMAGFIEAHVAARKPGAVLGLGYSNGANILASVIFARPKLFAGAVLMHPLIPFAPEVDGDLSQTAILVTAGRKDPICPPTLTHRFESYLEALKAPFETVWHDGAHEVRPVEIDAAKNFLGRWEMAMSGGIELREDGSKGRYVLTGPGDETAEMTFTKVGTRQIIIDHTEVPDAFRGQGAGLKLVERAVADARAAGKTIIPLCPFAAAQFRKHPEWADVLRK